MTSSTDESTWSGRRDRLLFLLLYNNCARIAEALQIQVRDLRERAVLFHGKGRKERIVPLCYGHRPTGCFTAGAGQIRSEPSSPYS